VGRSLQDIAGAASDVIVNASFGQVAAEGPVDALLHSTVSSLPVVWDQVAGPVGQGVSVISTCEELSYPWHTQDGTAWEMDTAARASGARLLGTGVNPGFVMDILPLILTSPCQEVTRLQVERVVDAAGRRGPLQRKVGAGLSPEEFDAMVSTGTVRHVGLMESARMIVDGLGWQVDEWEESIEPVLAEREMRTEVLTIGRGQVAGVRQSIRALNEGREKLHMNLSMYVGAADPHDRVCVSGSPDIDVLVRGGVHGDRATAGMVLNALPPLLLRPPGLVTMLGLLPVRCAAGRGA
jgi:4-hydroxy-tetrahydrodipicolinate reductase